jgi:hypothetical protein
MIQSLNCRERHQNDDGTSDDLDNWQCLLADGWVYDCLVFSRRLKAGAKRSASSSWTACLRRLVSIHYRGASETRFPVTTLDFSAHSYDSMKTVGVDSAVGASRFVI